MGVSARFVEKAAPTCMSTWQGDDLHAISGAKTVGNREDCSPLKQNLACSSAVGDEQRVSSLPSLSSHNYTLPARRSLPEGADNWEAKLEASSKRVQFY